MKFNKPKRYNGIGLLPENETDIPSLSQCQSNPEKIASLIDHTLLRPNATEREILALCGEAKTHEFMSVCVNPYWISLCAETLKDTPVRVCTVIGFPLGANHWSTKQKETEQAIQDGADEVDMVVNIGAMLSGNLNNVADDIRAVTEMARENGALSKVIFETAFFNLDQIKQLCELSAANGADFVKTSTGFASGGATVEHISLMRKTVGDKLGVKASGAVRDTATALAMLNAGATRIGTSSSLTIIGKANASKDVY